METGTVRETNKKKEPPRRDGPTITLGGGCLRHSRTASLNTLAGCHHSNSEYGMLLPSRIGALFPWLVGHSLWLRLRLRLPIQRCGFACAWAGRSDSWKRPALRPEFPLRGSDLNAFLPDFPFESAPYIIVLCTQPHCAWTAWCYPCHLGVVLLRRGHHRWEWHY